MSGMSCSKYNDRGGSGVISCFAHSDNGNFAVTAGHLFKASPQYRSEKRVQSPSALVNENPHLLGLIEKNSLVVKNQNVWEDYASIKVRSQTAFTNKHMIFGNTQGLRTLASLRVREKVVFYSTMNQVVGFGVVKSKRKDAWVSDANYKLKEVIHINLDPYKTVESGDSGSTVFDMQGRIIGIIVASKQTQSYLMPIERVFENLGIDLY